MNIKIIDKKINFSIILIYQIYTNKFTVRIFKFIYRLYFIKFFIYYTSIKLLNINYLQIKVKFKIYT